MRTGLLSTGGTVAWKQVRGRRLQHCHAPILQATHVILALAPENSKARTLRSVVAHARRNRRRPRPSTLTEGDPNVQEILDNQYGVLTDEMLSQEPPGHRSGYMAIVGRPNAGKSTLLNALLGQKLSIVTAKAQTTRHRVLGIISEDDFQLICLDTPGIMQAEKNKLDETMMRSVKRATRDADVILALVDASNSPEEALEYMEPGKLWSNQPWALVLNKVDKVSESEVERLKELFEKSTSADIIVPTCAVSGRGVPAIRSWAADHIPEGSSFYPKDFVTEHPERFFVAEIIREKIFLLYREEVPYAATVSRPQDAHGSEPVLRGMQRVSKGMQRVSKGIAGW
eukprot:jgi/Botrbrau1/10767/Bobra.180_2s0031.2